MKIINRGNNQPLWSFCTQAEVSEAIADNRDSLRRRVVSSLGLKFQIRKLSSLMVCLKTRGHLTSNLAIMKHHEVTTTAFSFVLITQGIQIVFILFTQCSSCAVNWMGCGETMVVLSTPIRKVRISGAITARTLLILLSVMVSIGWPYSASIINDSLSCQNGANIGVQWQLNALGCHGVHANETFSAVEWNHFNRHEESGFQWNTHFPTV